MVPVFTGQCHECADCTSERGSNICSLLPFRKHPTMPRDGTTRFMDTNGEPIYSFIGVSSFSEYTVVDVTQVVKLDAAVEHISKLCLLSCGVSTGTQTIYIFLFWENYLFCHQLFCHGKLKFLFL